MKNSEIDNRSALVSGRVVQVLVIIAALITGAGGIAYLVSSGNLTHNYGTFNGVAPFLKSVRGIINGALSFNSAAIMQLGVLVLITIPLIRVAVFLLSYLRERDWMYVIVSAIVMGVLLFSIAWR